MTDEDIRNMVALDEAAERAGGYVTPLKDSVHYDYRKILAYCKERGIKPEELTTHEVNQFIIPK